MQLASSRIWTRVAVSIFYDDNHYTTGYPIAAIAAITQYFKVRINGKMKQSREKELYLTYTSM